MAEERLHYIDYSKAVAIFFVVLGHVLLFVMSGEKSPVLGYLTEWIYSFHMPLFVFLSGLVIRTSFMNNSEIISDLYKRFRQLIVPFLLFGIIITLMWGLTWRDLFISDGKSGLWYLPVLFYLYLIVYLITLAKRITEKVWFEVLLYLLVYVVLKGMNHFLPDSLRGALCMYRLQLYFPIFAVAVLIQRKHLQDKIFGSKVCVFFATVLFAVLSLLQIKGCRFIMLDYYIAFSAIGSIIGLVYLLSNNGGKSWLLDYVGRRTVKVYIYHYLLIIPISIHCIGKGILDVFLAVLLAGLVIVASLLIDQIIDKIPRVNLTVFFSDRVV